MDPFVTGSYQPNHKSSEIIPKELNHHNRIESNMDIESSTTPPKKQNSSSGGNSTSEYKSPTNLARKDPNEEFFLMTLLSYKLTHKEIDRILAVISSFFII